MTFRNLARYLERLEKTSSRIEITKILAELFAKSNESEIDKVVYLILGNLAPIYSGVVFNLAEKMLVRALAGAYSIEVALVVEMYKKEGDLGEVAFRLANERKRKGNSYELSVREVHEKLLEIASDEGEGSQERKIEKMSKLISFLDPLSCRFVVRIPLGKLRLGFSDKTVIDALSWMETGSKEKRGKIETAYNLYPDVGLLAREVKKFGIDESVKRIKPEIGVPILPMLAQRLKSPKEMIEKMKKVFVEPKFDGLRIQIHYKRSGFSDGTKVKAFTRNLNETSWMFPELKGVERYINCQEAIFDSEGIGVDEERKSLANFQTTMTRRRKHDIEKIASKVSIKFCVFDLMYKDGESLVNLPYEERRKILSEVIKKNSLLEVVDYEVTQDPEVISRLMRERLKQGMEGIIVKKYDSKYVAGRTGWRWVKMKEEEGAKAKLADTVDCIVMGYSLGRGKRVSFGVGQFLVGILDGEIVKTVTKVGTGLTDEQFHELKKRLTGLEAKEKPKSYLVDKLLEPDFWVEPSLVVEIAADEITVSPTHSSGFALRFPRLVRFREDKSPKEATTITELKRLYKLQKN